MDQPRKSVVVIIAIIVAITGTAYNIAGNGKYKNLKVLPADISEIKLDSIMGAYNKALSVSCDFCHAKAKKDPFSLKPQTDELDYAIDIPMKEEARRMIRLQTDINKKYFLIDTTIRPEYLNVVGCNTCHRGNPYPAYE